MQLLARNGSHFLVGTEERCVVVDLKTKQVWPITTLDTVVRFGYWTEVEPRSFAEAEAFALAKPVLHPYPHLPTLPRATPGG
jgi:hypothetical protein